MTEQAAVRETGFTSIEDFQAEHRRLLRERGEREGSPAFLEEVESLVARGRRLGALLDRSGDRRAVQGLVDLWVNLLDRHLREPVEAELVDFRPELAPELPDEACPYLGLEAFQAEQKHLFFGREQSVSRLLDRLREGRFVSVVGPSGSGKSSVVQAGLLPALREGALPGSAEWRYPPPIVPGSEPLEALAGLIRGVTKNDTPGAGDLLADPSAAVPPLGDTPTVVVVDQFEELFPPRPMAGDAVVAGAAAFARALLALVEAGVAHRVIITLRADYEGHLGRFPELAELHRNHHERVMALGAGDLRRAIQGPAEIAELRFQEGVVERLVEDIQGEPAALPLLQFTLRALWDRKKKNRITLDAYRSLGGGRHALETVADAFYKKVLIPQEQTTARRIFMRLVKPGVGFDFTSKRMSRKQLLEAVGGPAKEVLDKLVDARLLRVRRGGRPDEDQIELVHEALVRNWSLLVEWLEKEKERMTVRRRLDEKAEEWIRLRPEGGLLSAIELAEAERWLTSQDADDLGHHEALPALVEASREAIDLARRRELERHERQLALAREVADSQAQLLTLQKRTTEALERRFTWLAVASVAALVLLISGLVMYFGQREAHRKYRAERDGRAVLDAYLKGSGLAAEARSVTSEDPELAILLARGAVEQVRSPDAVEALKEAAAKLGPEREVALARAREALQGAVAAYVPGGRLDHPGELFAVAFSSQGQLASGSGDGTTRVWSPVGGGYTTQELSVDSQAAIWGLGFHPDGRYLATASEDGAVRVYSAGDWSLTVSLVDDRRDPVSRAGRSREANAVAFSPVDDRLAAVYEDEVATVWDLGSGTPVRDLRGHEDRIFDVAYSPDGKLIATASVDETARIWDATTGDEVAVFEHGDRVYTVDFSPDGSRLLTASADKIGRIWELAGESARPTELRGHTDFVRSAVFSPTGTLVATGGKDRTVRLWDAGDGRELLTLGGHEEGVWSVAFRSDGKLLASAGEDGTIRTWTLPFAHDAEITDMAQSPDGERLATVDSRGRVKVWAADGFDPGLLEELDFGTEGGHHEVAFGPAGELLAVSGPDGRIRFRTESSEVIARQALPRESYDQIFSLAFAPGEPVRIAASTRRGRVLVWDVTESWELSPLIEDRASNREVYEVVFSPDGRLLAEAGYTETVRVRDLDGKEVAALQHPNGRVFGLAFAPGDRRLATAGGDGVLRVWDLDASESPTPLESGGEVGQRPISRVVFDRRGTRLATAGLGARVWEVTTGAQGPTLSAVNVLDHEDVITGVAFSNDGRYLFTSSYDRRLLALALDLDALIRRSKDLVVRSMTAEECATFPLAPECSSYSAGIGGGPSGM